jgi:hypothetical protein
LSKSNIPNGRYRHHRALDRDLSQLAAESA